MKTEISRDSHQPKKRYSGVYQQQGRMLTDADWNELVEILKERLNDALKDVVGNGSPLHRNIVNNETDPPNLQWGYVYVDGLQALVRADEGATQQPFFEYDHQQDFPLAPTLPVDYILYADVWERTVTHLMDERLRDKGLHGADTCTRKQIMAQVKWCADNIDPEIAAENPAKGDAELSVKLLQKTTQPDPCDPCAAQLDVESKLGNYLFRVEVHHVVGSANDPSEIILKWSSENGAEQYVLKDAEGVDVIPPDEFKSGQWTYEFFDETSEKHLGVHLAPGFTPDRDDLTETYPAVAPSRDFVRRWDGYCTLKKNGGNWDVAEQFDRSQSGSIEFSAIAAGKLTVNLDAQTLVLTLNNSFVAGDYWLAEVREAEHEAGDALLTDETPHGIEHHYLTLGTVLGGELQDNPEADRKYAFPPLTEMTRLFMAGGDGQEIMPGEALPQLLRVGVANGERSVQGATVRFQIEEGGGSLSPVNGGITTAEGIAECEWTPGSTIGAEYRVKATLVDPDHAGDASKDIDPPVYFYANLITADQVAYEPGCPDSGENAVHSLLAEDATVALVLGADGYYTVKEVLDVLLCKLAAKHVPYNPVPKQRRWADINDGPARPETVQQAIDDLVENLESTDIRYKVPDCGTTASPTVRSSLNISPVIHKIDEILDKLLCDFKATDLPMDRSADLCDKLKDDTQVKSVQDAINAICRMERGSGCAVTVGQGGRYPTLESAFASEELKKESQISICLLPGRHEIDNLYVSGKDSISITGHDAIIHLQSQLSLEALNITLSGIHFFAFDKGGKDDTGTGSITLSSHSDLAPTFNGGNVVVEHCQFFRLFFGKKDAKWQPLVTVGKKTNLKWAENSMVALRSYKEIHWAAIPKREMIPEAGLDAYDALAAVWLMNPHEEPEAFYAKATAAAKKILGLNSKIREEWYAKRPVSRINKLPNEPVRILKPSIESGRLEPIPGRVTPVSAPVMTDRFDRLAEVSHVSPRGEVKKFFELLKSTETINVVAITDTILAVAGLISRTDYALALESHDVQGQIMNNDFWGYVALHYDQDGEVLPLHWASTASQERQQNKNGWAGKYFPSDLLSRWQLSLSLFGNKFIAVHSMIPINTLTVIEGILDSGLVPGYARIEAYESMTVRDNIFYMESNSFISKFLNVSGNQFPYSAGESIVIYTLGYSGVFLGGQASQPTAVIEQILYQKEQAANLLTIV